MTHIKLYPCEVRGKPTMKSIQMFSHFHLGMLKGCRFPTGLKWSALTPRQVSHSDTYLAISHFILVHQNFFFKSWYILVPGWIEYHERRGSSMILRRSSKSFRTTRQSLNHRTPSASCQKHRTSSNSSLRWRWPIPSSVLRAATTSSLIVGIRDILFNLPCGTTRRLGSPGSQQEGWDLIVRWLHWGLCLEDLEPHSPLQDDNGLPTHNPWSVLAIFAASCSNQAKWTDTSDSCDRCRCALDYPKDSAYRLSVHDRQPRALGHGLGSALHGVKAVLRQKQLHVHLASICLQYPF
jgi:hypothetical protein